MIPNDPPRQNSLILIIPTKNIALEYERVEWKGIFVRHKPF